MGTAPFHYITTIGSIEITVAPPEYPPFEIDAIVEEQDTSLILGVEPEIRYPGESYDSLVNHMYVQQPRSPGEIIVKKSCPLRFCAIVHDIEQKPTWKEEWVATALKKLLYEIGKYQVKTVVMPLLGTVYGSMSDESFIKLLCVALRTVQPGYPEKIWLDVHGRTNVAGTWKSRSDEFLILQNRIRSFFEKYHASSP